MEILQGCHSQGKMDNGKISRSGNFFFSHGNLEKNDKIGN